MNPVRYCVLLKAQNSLKPTELARVLAAARKVPMMDLLNAAKACWGILEEDLPEAEARQWAGRLEAAGLAAVAVPRGLLEDLPEAATAAAESWARVVWTRVALVSASAINQTSSKTVITKEGPDIGQKAMKLGIMMATGLPINVGPQEREVARTVETSDLLFYLDIVLKDPDSRLRVDAQAFDFSVLGGAMTYSVVTNFRALVEAAAAKAPGALLGRGTRILLSGKPVREMGYASLKDVERESRWLLTLRELKLA